jgi:hypothetical protein
LVTSKYSLKNFYHAFEMGFDKEINGDKGAAFLKGIFLHGIQFLEDLTHLWRTFLVEF